MRTQAEVDQILDAPDIGQAMLRVAHSDLDWTENLDELSSALWTKFAISTPQVIRTSIEQLREARHAPFKAQADLAFDIALRLVETTLETDDSEPAPAP